jgi:hypothetical protein
MKGMRNIVMTEIVKGDETEIAKGKLSGLCAATLGCSRHEHRSASMSYLSSRTSVPQLPEQFQISAAAKLDYMRSQSRSFRDRSLRKC